MKSTEKCLIGVDMNTLNFGAGCAHEVAYA